MTSKIIVNTIEADTGISSVTFASNINLQNDSSVLVSSSGIRLGTGSTIAAPSANEIALSTNSAERVRITSAGKIGVGVASPSQMLEITNTSSTGSQIQLRDTSTASGTNNGVRFGYNGSGAQIWNFESTFIRFATSNAERLRITSDGKVIIGATSAGGLFSVHQSASSANYINITNGVTGSSSWSNGMLLGPNSSGDALVWQNENLDLRFGTNNLDRMRITSAGRVGINQSTPQTTFHSTGTTNGQQATFGIDDSGLKISTFQKTDNDAGVILDAQKSSNGTLTFATTGTERLRITSDGNMGLGVSPSYSGVFGGSQRVLHIGGTAAPGLRIQSSTSNQGDFIIQAGNSGGATYLSNLSNNADTAFYNTSGGSATEKLRITHNGYILKSDTPAFKCKLSGATGANFTGVLVFGNVSYNIGSHYNSSNGRFTAPVDGRYLFAWYTNMERAGGNGSFYADWKINGNNQGNRMYTHHSGAWEQICGTVIFDLNANDYVEINAITSGNWDGGSYGSYSGYLLG